ncbi:MAG: RIP metalloprotease RseP [Myxococcales bacterium]
MAFLQSAGTTLLAFAVLISVIVFIHELGHLLVGKWMGVKAVRFSIGFGPRLWGFQWGETEYRLSLLPFGGYVKFAGDNPLEELPAEDQGRGFLEQPPHKKAAIAIAGPAANFVLAVGLLFVLYAFPQIDIAAVVGSVKPGSPAAQAGLRYGDRIVAIDGTPIEGFTALQEMVGARAGQATRFTLQRGSQTVDTTVVPSTYDESDPIETVKRGRIGIMPTPFAAEIAVEQGSPAARAGLRDFDRVVRLAGEPVGNYEQLALRLASLHGPVPVDVLRREEVGAPGATLWKEKPVHVTLEANGSESGIELAHLSLFFVQPGSGAAEAGLRRGDRVMSINGNQVGWWVDDVERAVKAAGADPFQMTVRRGNELLTVTVRQHMKTGRNDAGVRAQLPDLGAGPDPALRNVEPTFISVHSSIPTAFGRSTSEIASMTRKMVLGLQRIAVGRISAEAISGPLTIAEVARKAADAGWKTFLWWMALISLNLGVLNLVPIPVLDGFHVLSAGIEGVRRRPLSVRFREIANLVGVALVLALMLFALRNDAVRMFLD